MNVGAIFGQVQPINSAFIRFDGIWHDHIDNALTVYNVKTGAENNLGLIEPDEDNYFVIPFHWEEQDLGDFMGSRFVVKAFDTVENKFARYEGNLHIGKDPKSEWDSAVDEIDGILELAKFPLAAAVKTVFSPKLSTANMIAIGAAELIIV